MKAHVLEPKNLFEPYNSQIFAGKARFFYFLIVLGVGGSLSIPEPSWDGAGLCSLDRKSVV